MKRPQQGLTLIEILVAMSLLAILSVLGYKAFGSLLIARERLMQTGEHWVQLARVFRRVEGDVARLPTEPPPGAQQGSAPQRDRLLLEPDDGGRQRLSLKLFSARYPGGRERITYRGGDGLSWQAADADGGDAGTTYPLLAPGQRVSWEVLLDDGRTLTQWPVPDVETRRARALLMRVTLAGGQTVHRIWNLP